MSKTDGGSILLFTDRDRVDIMELKERVYYAEQEEKTEKEKSENGTLEQLRGSVCLSAGAFDRRQRILQQPFQQGNDHQ